MIGKAKDNQSSGGTWMQNMRSGQFEQAWKFSEQVLLSGANRNYKHLPRHLQSIWDGTPLEAKRVLVRCYHGLGDTIQFIRYAPLLKGVAQEVIVWAQTPLIELLATVEGIDQLVPLHDGAFEGDYEADVEIMELPFIFRTSLDTIPAQVPYISVPPLLLSKNKQQINVGLVWQAGNWDISRNIPFLLLQPLLGIKDVNIYILQANATAAGWQEGLGIHPGEFSLHDYARVIRGLDLLITVDSMPAHLAGALGVPVWTLLHAASDWRWMEHRSDSPWYPSMKIFRQVQEGDWEPVINQVTAALQLLTKS
jgi:hypothetical protein